MNIKVVNNSYKNNQRVCEQVITYTKSEDLQTLGNLYFRLSNIESQISGTDASDKSLIDKLEQDMKDALHEIEVYKGYIAGYEKGAV